MARVGLIALVASLLAMGCGARNAHDGGARSTEPVVARVGPNTIGAAEVAGLLAQVRQSFKVRGRVFPSTSDPYYADLRDEAVRYLVEQRLRDQVAAKLGIEVSDGDVDRALEHVDPSAMRRSAVTMSELRRDVRHQLRDSATYDAIARSRASGETVREALSRWRKQLERDFQDVVYGPGYRPAEYRRSVPPEIRNLPKPRSKCDLRDGIYPYLVARAHGCLDPGDPALLSSDMPPCPEVPASAAVFDIGLTPEQVNSGYEDYAQAGAAGHGFFEQLTTNKDDLAFAAGSEGPECADFAVEYEVSVGSGGRLGGRPPFSVPTPGG